MRANTGFRSSLPRPVRAVAGLTLALLLGAASCVGDDGQPAIDDGDVGGETRAVTTCPPNFTDVPANHWAALPINTGACLGITSGCTASEFCPDSPLTRGMAAVFIVRAYFGENFTYSQTPYFPVDVPATHPWFKYVQKMKEAGITNGCETGTFCVNDALANLTTAVFLQRAHYGCDSCFSDSNPQAYLDVTNPSDWYYKHIQKMRYDLGWTNVGTNYFYPNSITTRAQMMFWLHYRKPWTPWCSTATALQDSPGSVPGALQTYFTHPMVQPDHLDCRTAATGDYGNAVPGRLVSALWQRTASANDFPVTWDIGASSGLSGGATPSARFVQQRGAVDTASTTALQMKDDAVGMYLAGAAPQSQVSPGVANFDFPATTDHRPFASATSELAFMSEMQVPTASRASGAEVYVAAVFRFKDRRPGNEGREFWYSMQAFDLRPAQPEGPAIDGCPQCSGWVIAFTRFGAGTRYGHLGPGSYSFTQTPWSGWRPYDNRVNAFEFARALRDIKCRFALDDTQLSPDPADYQLVHFNWNPETYVPSGATATLGASVRNIRIARFSNTGPTQGTLYDQVVVNAANGTTTPAAAQQAQLFYITEDEPVWNEQKSRVVTFPNNGGQQDLVFDFSGDACWNGTITGIRFDPFDCASAAGGCDNACFNVDSIDVRTAGGSIYPGADWHFSGPAFNPLPNPYQGWGWSSLARTWADGLGLWGACVGPSPNGFYGDPQTARGVSIATGR